jgi:hypothetical protein
MNVKIVSPKIEMVIYRYEIYLQHILQLNNNYEIYFDNKQSYKVVID